MMPQTGRQPLQLLGEKVLDPLFPARCVNCKQTTGALCPTCLAAIHSINTPTCSRCGSPLLTRATPCLECRAHPLAITRLEAVTWHEGVVREAIHALKYNRRPDVAKPLARLVADKLAEQQRVYDFISCVPLHPTRELERGYNQAELLAKHIAAGSGLDYQHVLRRTRATQDQIGLDSKARRANVANAFAANPALSKNRTILLIDDVTTTGATLDACAVALLAAGARAVYGMCVTRPRPAV